MTISKEILLPLENTISVAESKIREANQRTKDTFMLLKMRRWKFVKMSYNKIYFSCAKKDILV